MRPKPHPLRPWLVAGGLIAAAATVLGTAGDAVSTWQSLLAWINTHLGLGPQSFLINHEKLLFILTLLLLASSLGFLRWVADIVIVRKMGRSEHRRPSNEERTRAAYLTFLEEDIEQRLKASLHRARFLDLGLAESQGMTTPWHYVYKDSESELRSFTSIDDAFDFFHHRLLLLGSPGSGKSTTLLHLAHHLIQEAKRDPQAPIPVVLNLASYRGTGKSKRQSLSRSPQSELTPEQITSFDHWLVSQIEARPVYKIRALARTWVEEGRLALLLDGLDEVDENRVADLIRDLNESFFWRNPDLPAVICSRIFEYERISQDRELRLRLRGAVTLQPLTPEQIDIYLEKSQATDLREALVGDSELRELARNPLTLSMMVLAYGSLTSVEIPTHLPLEERKRHLFDFYTSRMLQRKARRDRNIPFDFNQEANVSLAYSYDQVNRFLGWLAVQLSERSLTGFAPDSLVNLLRHESSLRQRVLFWTPITLAFSIYAIIISLATAAGIVLAGGTGSPRLAISMALSGLAAFVLFPRRIVGEEESRSNSSDAISAFIIFFSVFVIFGIVANSLRAIVPTSFPSLWSGSAMIILLSLLFNISGLAFRDKLRLLGRGALTALVVFLGCALGGQRELAIFALHLGLAAAIFYELYKDSETPFVAFGSVFLGLGVTLIGLGQLAVVLTAKPSPLLVGSSICWSLGILIGFTSVLGMDLVVLGFSVGSIIGIAVGGPFGAWACAIAFCWLTAITYGEDSFLDSRMAKYIINPCLLVVLFLGRRTPWRFMKFVAYAREAMLLKKSGMECEFIHRLLRDHFAVRELIPLLYDAKGQVQLEVIERLSLQGEASLEALSGLTHHSNSVIRRAATAGLARIPNPAAAQLLMEILKTDPEPSNRVEAVKALGISSEQGILDALRMAIGDPSAEVRESIMDAVGKKFSKQRSLRRHIIDSAPLMSLLYGGLGDADDRVFRAAVDAIGKCLRVGHEEEGFAPQLEASRVQSLLKVGSRLRSFLDDSAVGVRAASLQLVGLLRDQEALPKILKALDAREVSVRAAALLALGRIGGQPAVLPLLAAVRRRPRWVAVEALGMAFSVFDPDIPEALRDAARNGLLRALRDWNPRVRENAAHALIAFPHPTVLSTLQRVSYRDRSRNVQSAANHVLQELDRPGRN